MVHLQNGLKTGFAGNRTVAVFAAIKAIKGAAKQERQAARRQ